MFVGHYAAGIAAKAAKPDIPMWSLIAGSQLVDIGWSVFIMTGVERGRADPSLPGSAFILDYMPWTHSLAGALVWSLAAMLAGRAVLKLGWQSASLLGAVVFSHWLLDLVVHRPDLELWPAGPKAGFALWNFPVAEQAVEIGLIAIAAVYWAASRVRLGQPVWPAAAFVKFLVILQIVAMLLPAAEGPLGLATGGPALAVYVLAALLALPLDGRWAAQSSGST